MGIEVRVIGPPGCGKTTYMARTIKATVEKLGPGSAMVVAFTKAAARELATRDMGGMDAPSAWTLHAACYRLLGSPQIADRRVDEWNAVRAAGTTSWKLSGGAGADLDDIVGGPRGTAEGDGLMEMIQRRRALLQPVPLWGHTPEGAMFAEWTAWKKANGYVDFTDMIEQVLWQGLPPPGAPRVLFADEVQDMSPLELKLLRQWGAQCDRGVMIAGDPDQSIYGFKGASPRAFYEPEIAAESYKILGEGYRVPRAVHAWSKRWISADTEHRAVEYSPRKGDDGKLLDWSGDPSCNFDYADQLVPRVMGRADGRSVMFLASCGYMLAQVIAKLRADGVPFHNPYQVRNGAWNPMRGCVDRLRAFLKQGAQWNWRELRLWTELLEARGVLKHGARALIGVKAKDTKVSGEVVTELELSSMLEPQFLGALRHQLDSAEKPWQWLMRSATHEGAAKIGYAASLADAGTLFQTPRVIVGTIHSVKGAEADVVCVSPDLSRQGYDAYTNNGRNGVARLFYVAGTRARHELLLASQAKGMGVW